MTYHAEQPIKHRISVNKSHDRNYKYVGNYVKGYVWSFTQFTVVTRKSCKRSRHWQFVHVWLSVGPIFTIRCISLQFYQHLFLWSRYNCLRWRTYKWLHDACIRKSGPRSKYKPVKRLLYFSELPSRISMAVSKTGTGALDHVTHLSLTEPAAGTTGVVLKWRKG